MQLESISENEAVDLIPIKAAETVRPRVKHRSLMRSRKCPEQFACDLQQPLEEHWDQEIGAIFAASKDRHLEIRRAYLESAKKENQWREKCNSEYMAMTAKVLRSLRRIGDTDIYEEELQLLDHQVHFAQKTRAMQDDLRDAVMAQTERLIDRLQQAERLRAADPCEQRVQPANGSQCGNIYINI